MRYNEESVAELPVYSQSEGLHFMLNFTVFLALLIAVVLLGLARKGKVLWLTVWSVGLLLFSVAYLGAAAMDLI